MRLRSLWIAGSLLLSSLAQAGDGFPGQNDLATGLACHTNLDMECARTRLEKALSEFSPEADSHFLEHVCSARFVLALIDVANDDLQNAERQFANLLLLDPDFRLPPGDYPPKVQYVFKQAKEARKEKVTRPPVVTQPTSQPLSGRTVRPTADLPAQSRRAPFLELNRFFISSAARAVALFDPGPEAPGSGPGAALSAGLGLSDTLLLFLTLGYAYHPLPEDQRALQALSVVAAGQAGLPLGAFELRLGGGLGMLSMGTSDRYDHWGFVLEGAFAAAWPRAGRFAAVLGLNPAVVMTEQNASFFLTVGLALEYRWPSP